MRIVGPLALLTNHGAALLCIAEDPRIRMREIAASGEGRRDGMEPAAV